MKVLSRHEYDVRFLKIPGRLNPDRLESRIEKEIRHNFPGNHGQYLHFYKSLGKDNYIAAIINKDVFEKYRGESLSVPALLLPEIMKKTGRKLPAKLVIWAEDSGEEILFDSEGTPSSSRLLNQVDPGIDAGWVEVSSFPDAGGERISETINFPAEKLLLKKPVSPAGGRISMGKKLHFPAQRTLFPVLLITTLVSAFLALNAWTAVREDLIDTLKGKVERRQALVLEIDALEKEISNLEYGTGTMIPDPGPCSLLSGLYTAGEGLFSITGLGFENDTFSIEAAGPDPMALSGRLSDTGNFYDINILKIRQVRDGFKFSLKGRFHE